MIMTAAALVLVLGLAGAGVAAKLAGRPTSTAVVDVQRVFDNLKEKVQIEADMTGKGDKLREKDQKWQTDLNQMKADLDLLTPGTESFQKKEEELAKSAIERQAWLNFEQQKLNRDRGLFIESLYRKMVGAVEAVAKSNGNDVVFFAEGAPTFRYENPQQLTTLIQVRKLLYSAPDLDITDQVTQKMNNDYSNR
jgi:Skp family chaperone for outer membrane proteins